MNRLLVSLLLWLSATAAMAQQPAVEQLVRRVTNGTGIDIVPKIAPAGNGRDFFEIASQSGKITVTGNTPVNVATGVNWYLKYYAGTHLTWNNMTTTLPANLPQVPQPERHETNLPLRYYLNYCTHSYSMAFWDWARWEQELDWMALHGINLCLSITGTEVVWYNLLKRIGYSTDEINAFISGPAFMAWWQMSNLEGWGGPNSEEWYAQQEALQKKILARMHELGIEPVLPGFGGMVPRNISEKLDYQITDQGTWNGIPRPAFLRPDDPNFGKFAAMYYEEVEKLYGKAKYYAIDLFHEGGSTSGIDLDAAGKTTMAAMKQANPEAVWVIQGWQSNPRPAMIANLPAHDLLVLDLCSEKRPQWGDPNSIWYRKEGYGRHDWIYCMLLNFGGRTGIYGMMDNVINGFYDARAHTAGNTLRGVGATPEAIDNNPVMYELLFELPWRSERFTKETWLDTYVAARYGKSHPAVREAWQLLGDYSYNCPRSYHDDGPLESLFCARPSIHPTKASSWGSAVRYYDPAHTRRAAELLLSAADSFRGSANFKYDLIDVLRQSIADRGSVLSKNIGEACEAKNIAQFKTLSDSFLLAIQCQDELLATHYSFRTGHWIAQAKSLSTQPALRDLYEWNARTLITIWGDRTASEQGGLHDYSCREWNGLLADLYYKRWKTFFDHTLKTLQGESLPPIDFFAMDEAWTRERKTYGAASEGDAVQVARNVYNKVFPQ